MVAGAAPAPAGYVRRLKFFPEFLSGSEFGFASYYQKPQLRYLPTRSGSPTCGPKPAAWTPILDDPATGPKILATPESSACHKRESCLYWLEKPAAGRAT